MARIHDLFIVELAEVIKGYGNNPDVEDPFSLSEFYRFYELPNIAVSKENFEKMRPVEKEECKVQFSDKDHVWINGKQYISLRRFGEAVKEARETKSEPIKCKDCRYGVDYYHEGVCYCSNPKWGLKYFGGSWEFYCADAERKEEQ